MADTPAISKQTVAQVGESLAQDKYSTDSASFVSRVAADITSGDTVKRVLAQQMATEFTSNLLLLVLVQELQKEYRLSPFKWVNKFDDQKIEEGNTKQYIRHVATGADPYDVNIFAPITITEPQQASTDFGLYQRTTDGNIKLGVNAYQFKKPLTITAQQWIPFFTSGKLQEFIANITELINTTYEMFKISKVQTLIQNIIKTDSGIFKKRITGTATDLLSAFTTEIYPQLTRMQAQVSDEYNLFDTTPQSINSVDPEDVLMLMNQDVYTKYVGGVLAPIFNNQLVDFGKFIPKENIIPVAKGLVVGDSKTAITATAADILDTNTIVVLNKNSIKHLWWVDQVERQMWAENMAIQVVMHVWGAFGVIPWGQGFIYTNPNLNKVPGTNSTPAPTAANSGGAKVKKSIPMTIQTDATTPAQTLAMQSASQPAASKPAPSPVQDIKLDNQPKMVLK